MTNFGVVDVGVMMGFISCFLFLVLLNPIFRWEHLGVSVVRALVLSVCLLDRSLQLPNETRAMLAGWFGEVWCVCWILFFLFLLEEGCGWRGTFVEQGDRERGLPTCLGGGTLV